MQSVSLEQVSGKSFGLDKDNEAYSDQIVRLVRSSDTQLFFLCFYSHFTIITVIIVVVKLLVQYFVSIRLRSFLIISIKQRMLQTTAGRY